MHKGLLHSLFLSIILVTFTVSKVKSQDNPFCLPPPCLAQSTPWADSVLTTMSLDQKIGQLFMVAAYSNRDKAHVQEIEELIANQHIGGLIFMQGGPIRQAQLTNKYQELSDTPLLLAMDAEWGLAMRLDSTVKFPRQMSLGASADEDLVYSYGQEMARQLKRLGVHVSFSPVVDVNNNAANPVIGSRSFGENRELVTNLGIACMRGLQDGGILANAKHFPGHGDTDKDSHQTLPVITHSRARLDSIELYPFKKMINQGLGSMMIAHLNIPALDTETSTLSKKIVTDLLREDLAFDGLIFTDALNMKGVASFYEPGEVDLKALLAGNDILLFPGNVPRAIQLIKEALINGQLTEGELDEHVSRILKVKEWTQAYRAEKVKITSLYEDLNSQKAHAMHQRIVESSLTIVQNDGVLPLNKTAEQKIAILTIGKGNEKALEFQQALKTYSDADFFKLPFRPDFQSMRNTVSELGGYDVVIVNMVNTSNSPSKKFGLSQQAFDLALDLNRQTKVILNWFGNPYALKFMNGAEQFNALMVAYHDDKNTIETVARVMTGGANAKGTLPVTVNNRYPQGLGYPLSASHQLRRTYPEYIGISSEDLDKIDSIVYNGIKKQAFPGCRVLAAKDGNVFLDRSYGHLTYEEKAPVNEGTVYDLASITKVVATTAAIMRLVDEGKIDIEYNLCDYLDLADTSTHFQIKLKEMLSHKAQLKAWIPFYYDTLEKGKLNSDIYSKTRSPEFDLMVAKGIYMKNTYVDSMFTAIEKSGLRSREGYKYSDLGYYYLKKIVEKVSGTSLNNFVDSVFYQPMGLQSMGYYPLSHLPMNNIAPTEYDAVFRKQLIQGHVHDPGAAMIGGVGGHAGVFSNGFDLMAMTDMFMNEGNYQGRSYLSKEVLSYFTRCHYCEEEIRRGIGFDKPALHAGTGPTSREAPASSYGHSGFTGTLTWADPENGLIYVFLSNRVYPNADNKKLLKMNIRTDIQAAIYEALKNAEERNSMQVFPEWKAQR